MFTKTILSPQQAATKIEDAMTLMIGKFMTIDPP
jgi:acyl CoA:acetate/3-ketoacid CoA transferase alpha subunit